MSQLNYTDLNNLNSDNLPDNNQRLISASKLREVISSLIESLGLLYDKLGYDYYNPAKTYNNNDITLYGDRLFKKINGSGTGITPTNGVDWLLLTNTPFATEEFYGFLRLASLQETLDGLDDNTAVSPKNLATRLEDIASEYTGGNGITVDNINSLINFIGGTVSVNFLQFITQATTTLAMIATDGDVQLNASQNVDLTAQDDVVVNTTSGKLKLEYENSLNQYTYIDGNKRIISKKLPFEISYSFVQNTNVYQDLIVNPLEILSVNKTISITLVEISINNGAFNDISTLLPLTINSNDLIYLRVTFDSGYNSGVVVLNGEKI